MAALPRFAVLFLVSLEFLEPLKLLELLELAQLVGIGASRRRRFAVGRASRFELIRFGRFRRLVPRLLSIRHGSIMPQRV